MTISATSKGLKNGVCTSTNRPANPYDGMMIYETDTDKVAVYDVNAWVYKTGTAAPITGYKLNVTATATTSITISTATTILSGSATIVPGRLYQVYGSCALQSGLTINVKALWVAQSSSSFVRSLYYVPFVTTANLPFSMQGTTTFSASDVGVTTGSGTALTFDLRVYFNGSSGSIGLNTNPDGIVGANSFPQVLTIIDIGAI
jgi:hypothetical protein